MNVNMHMAIIAAVAVIRLHDHPLSAEAQTQNFLNILSRCLPTPESFLLMTTTMKPTSADIRAKTNIDSGNTHVKPITVKVVYVRTYCSPRIPAHVTKVCELCTPVTPFHGTSAHVVTIVAFRVAVSNFLCALDTAFH